MAKGMAKGKEQVARVEEMEVLEMVLEVDQEEAMEIQEQLMETKPMEMEVEHSGGSMAEASTAGELECCFSGLAKLLRAGEIGEVHCLIFLDFFI